MKQKSEIKRTGPELLKRLLRQREKHRLTQEEVAERAGITTRAYSYLESGIHTPTLQTALYLSCVLDFSLDELNAEIIRQAVHPI